MKLKTTIQTLAAVMTVALAHLAQAKDNEVPGVAEQTDSYFYTGKPYAADLGAYTFAYRNYDPQIKPVDYQRSERIS